LGTDIIQKVYGVCLDEGEKPLVSLCRLLGRIQESPKKGINRHPPSNYANTHFFPGSRAFILFKEVFFFLMGRIILFYYENIFWQCWGLNPES
jgi:hypothetical protein